MLLAEAGAQCRSLLADAGGGDGGAGAAEEAAGLSDEERRESLRVASESAAKEKVLIAGVGADSVAGAVRIAEWAAEAKFDAVLLRAPIGWQRLVRGESLTQVELFFRAVADRSPLPVVLWSDASAGGFEIPVEMVGALAGHPNVIGLMDAGLTAERLSAVRAATADVKREVTVTTVFAAVTGRMLEVSREGEATFVAADALLSGGASVAVAPPKAAIKTRTKTVGFQVVDAGAASASVDLLEAGVQGVMPELAACAPQGCHEVWAAFKDGDPQLARLKAERLRRGGCGGVRARGCGREVCVRSEWVFWWGSETAEGGVDGGGEGAGRAGVPRGEELGRC